MRDCAADERAVVQADSRQHVGRRLAAVGLSLRRARSLGRESVDVDSRSRSGAACGRCVVGAGRRRTAATPVRHELRCYPFLSARCARRARHPVREQRVHARRADVSRASRHDRRVARSGSRIHRQESARSGRCEGGDGCFRRRDRARRRALADGQGLALQPAHHRRNTDGHRRSRAWRSAAADAGRSGRSASAGHVRQLRRRRNAVGHLPDRRREHSGLLRQSRTAQGAQRRRSAHRRVAPPLAHVEGALAVCVGGGRCPLRPAAHADRAVPPRLDRRDRSARSDPRAGQAHCARSHGA